MQLRVVVYTEGAGESGGELTLPPPPGDPLDEKSLGPAHVLIRRCIGHVSTLPEGAVRFDAPLRTGSGRVARGSDLLRRPVLRALHVWPEISRRPGLSVVLIDRDGDSSRRRLVETYLAGLTVPHVIGVPIEEFESWLLADSGSIREILGTSPPTVSPPESMAPGEAKRTLSEWFARYGGDRDTRFLRLEVSHRAALASIERVSSSFEHFLKELRERLPPRMPIA